MLANSPKADDSLIPTDDIQYVEDMGLIKRERGKPRRIANGIYQEIIPRELTWSTQDGLIQEPQWLICRLRSEDEKSIKVCLYNDFSHVHTIKTETWGYILNNENLF